MTDTPYSLYNRKGIHDIAVNPFYYLMFIYRGKAWIYSFVTSAASWLA